ncbi:MAG: radical SAM protein [Bacteroidetes bacterium]|nr:MAG: radical SAM protein [Bacteroidota bacterium]
MSRSRDYWQIIKHLSVQRVFNLMRLKCSFWWTRLTKRPRIWGKPFALSIEPTTACNLGCPECPSGLKMFTRPTGKMDLKKHEQMLDQVGRQLFYINYYFQGEPFLHPDFLELIKAAKQRKIYTSTSTNAHFITEAKAREIVNSGLDRLLISIDGTTQDTYEQYRVHGSLEKVLAGARAMVEAKRQLKSATPHLIFQFLVVRPNEHQVEEVFDLAREMDIDEVRIKTAQIYDYKQGNPLIPENEKYSRYRKQKDGSYRMKAGEGNHCWRMWSSCVITWDGQVVPCCFDKDATHTLGKIPETEFNQIWKGESYSEFRSQLFRARDQIEICKNCSEGTKVWV